ncbi:CotH kinase family protein [Maribellus sp. YY47]|uniref:CotH kinase family protein n=1 Tax=Maribellus sp. YY47 TaxID=2929486 RepID=UPI0020010F53|nr:CotH kinase family protein [Maribellus sp. YY47]MCK3685326.1 CotH kinase family protein [Maribellus sp. YY47]
MTAIQKYGYALLCYLLCLIPVKAFSNLHWESVFHPDTIFQYALSNDGAPDSNWRNLNFDASGWSQGKGGIGYADNDDNTIIDPTNALFLRRTFFIHNTSEIENALLSIDYDDAFVAYLNGREIARSGGLSAGFPAFDEISTVNHEAQLYQGGKYESFLVDKTQLAGLLLEGENVLAVEVHNSSVNSSDMSSTLLFSVEVNSEQMHYLPLPEGLETPLVFTSSNLPIFVIDTQGQTIVDEPKVNVHLGVIDNGPGKRNYLSAPFNHYDGTIGIELRGNSTQSFPKKPYTFETRLENGDNNDVALLGFPAENDWILRASYYDHTFLRNPVAHQMSRLQGNWSSGNKHCEVVLNGEYQGVYILVEKIKRTKERLDIAKLNPDEISGEDLTGGYIYEIAGQIVGQYGEFGEARRLRYPDIDDVAPEQLAYIRKYDDDFRYAMQQFNTNDPGQLYAKWIDVMSFVDYMLVQEASRNPDGYGWSCYFHKDKNSVLEAGPVWDFDQSMHNSTYRDGDRWWGWSIDYHLWPDPPFYMDMIHEPYFSYQMKKRWEELRQDKWSTENMFQFIDSIATNLTEATERNFKKWPNLGVLIWRELPGFELLDTYPKQVESLKTYLEQRWKWMDEELAKVQVYTVIEEVQNDTKLEMYPNPATSFLNVDLTLAGGQPVLLTLYNNLGQPLLQTDVGLLTTGKNHVHLTLPDHLATGVYLMQVRIGEKQVLTQRFIKTDR